MSSKESFTERRGGRGHPSHKLEAAPRGDSTWRRTLAALAISALAVSGMSALAAAPAAAEEATGAATEEVVGTTNEASGSEVAEEAKNKDAETLAVDVDMSAPEVGAPAPEAEVPAPAPELAETPQEVTEAPAGDAAARAAAPSEDAAATDVTPLLIPPPPDVVVDKVEICHATSSYQNPYIINEPAADGDVSGHADHTGPIFFPEIPKHTEWGDIIPPFLYDDGDETPGFFPGLNWDAVGQEIFANDCEIPTPEPELAVFPEGCRFYLDFGTLEVEVGPVLVNVDYRVIVSDSEGNPVVDEWLISGQTGTVSNFWILPPGDYTITLEQSIIEGEWDLLDEQAFTIFPCPVLGIAAEPGDCSTGDDGTVVLTFTGLIVPESYDWSVTGDGYTNGGTIAPTGPSAEIALSDLPPGDFTASIEFVPGPGAELVPGEVATTTFTVVPCPPPAKPVTPAGLAVTGTEPAPFLSAALLLFGLGGAMLLATSRRRAGSSRTE